METYFGIVTTVILALLGAEWIFALWINKQFSAMRTLVYDSAKELQNSILTKLEYHEKHDDQRFSQLEKNIWEIRVRNASIDGEKSRDQTTIRRQTEP